MKAMYGHDGAGHRIHMRGLPFRATEDDIAEVDVMEMRINDTPV